jgi:hypothetical protein
MVEIRDTTIKSGSYCLEMRAQLAADVRQEQERIVGCACGGWNRCAFGCMSL